MHVFISIYLSIYYIDSHMLGIDNLIIKYIYKKIRLVNCVHLLQQLRSIANPRCSRLRYRGLIPEIIFKGIQLQTKQSTIYSYFSGHVSNNEPFFANGKILPIFVNQTISVYSQYTRQCKTCMPKRNSGQL